MKVGLQSQIVNTYSKTDKTCGDIWGDEIMCFGIKRVLEEREDIQFVGVYDKRNKPPADLDVLINLYPPDVGLIANAKSNILWFQVPANYYNWRHRAPELNKIFKAFLFASKMLYDEAMHRGFQNCMFFPMSADHKLYKKTDKEKTKNVVFVGNNNGARHASRIDNLLIPAMEFGLEIYGMRWNKHPKLKDCWKGNIHPHDVPDLYNSSKIVLSIHPDGHLDSDMPTSRVFEALACGVFVLSDRVPTLVNMFPRLGYMSDANECKNVLQKYLSDDQKREKQAKEMHEKFLQTWTWDRLVSDLFQIIK